SAHDDLLAVRDARLDPTGAVRHAPAVRLDLVMRLGAAQRGEREAVTDLDALHRLDAHHRGGETRIEAILLRRVRAEPRRHTRRAHLDDPADGVALRARLVDRALECRLVLHQAGDLDPDRAQ